MAPTPTDFSSNAKPWSAVWFLSANDIVASGVREFYVAGFDIGARVPKLIFGLNRRSLGWVGLTSWAAGAPPA